MNAVKHDRSLVQKSEFCFTGQMAHCEWSCLRCKRKHVLASIFVMMHGARSVTAAVAAAACEGCSNACGCLNHVICCLFCSILARHLLRLSIYSFTSMSAASVPSPAIKITNLRRPFTEKALRSLLAEFGSYDFFWLSRIKDVCLLQYDSLASAARALPELNGRTWPEHGAPARTQRPCIHSMHMCLCL